MTEVDLRDPALGKDRELARRMPRGWHAFFERFGRLTAVQRESAPHILAGRDVLVCSATASGKTEAACAPLVERHLDRGAGSWTVLYISPTRALINDLHSRLAGPLEGLGVRVARRTGEYHDPLEPTPEVILTTPESFDSLMCSALGKQGHVLGRTVAVVLDEVHLLHGTPRGEQVRWLLERLRRMRQQALHEGWARDPSVQVVALSATVPDPEAVRTTYLSDGVLVQIPGGRGIDAVEPPAGPSIGSALPALLQESTDSLRVLAFSNSRRRVDTLAVELRPLLAPLGYTVYAHHSSLSAKERLAAEAAIRDRERVVVFATSTLEIGIDIGNIDLVVLDGPAPNIPALLQRIGRGNRRTDRTRVLPCAGSLSEVVVHAAMLDAARDGWLGPAERGPQLAVARQQAASYIYQSSGGWRSSRRLIGFLSTFLPAGDAEALVDEMVSTGELEFHVDRLRLGEKWLEDTAIYGRIHSTIEGTPGVSVVDEASGQTIVAGVNFRGGSGLHAGGKLLQVRKWADYRLEVRQVKDSGLAVGDWGYRSRAWMEGAGQPQAVRHYFGIDPNDWVVLHDSVQTHAFHFGGGRRKAVLELVASSTAGTPRIAANGWFVTFPGTVEEKPAWLGRATPALLDVAIGTRLAALERSLGRPMANRHLPEAMRVEEVRGWLDIPGELQALSTARWTPVTDPVLRGVLEVLRSDVGAR